MSKKHNRRWLNVSEAEYNRRMEARRRRNDYTADGPGCMGVTFIIIMIMLIIWFLLHVRIV